MDLTNLKAGAEAILFAAGEPIALKRLAEALEIGSTDMVQVLDSLAAELDERQSGICLKRLGDRYQLCTRSEYSENVRKVLELRRNQPLSQAAFEVLAVVAYNQPVTKAFVEQVRGVDCSGVMGSLLAKGLIEERGRLDLPGKPIVYGTTPAFLRCFCIESLDELPPLPESAPKEQEEESAPLSEDSKDNDE